MYKVEYSLRAQKALRKLDKDTARLLYAWTGKNLEGCKDPRVHGKGLSANRSGQWRYRIGGYRLITEIREEKLIILVLEIGHRSDIYQ
ncbi:MAG: type II toxin-antitoxin system RelE/ParE family toxin [Coriobacteriia bacterium]|nr:type II toxin-antitoxin system RelE/ParE family toxin [Coriobacteriia bacterium]